MHTIKITNQKPDIYERLHEVFGVEWDNGLIIANKTGIHCKFELPPEKIAHEATHLRQQENVDIDEWWNRYILDKDFRLEMEIEACREEVNYIQAAYRDRNRRARMIHQVAVSLSSKMYGNMISYAEAKKAIEK